MPTHSVIDQQSVDLLPKRDVEVTTKLRPVTGPPNRHAAGRPNGVPVQLPPVPRLGRSRRHALGAPNTVHICRRFPGLVDARTHGGAW